jgi:hypothetical protein
MEVDMEQINQFQVNRGNGQASAGSRIEEVAGLRAHAHACKVSQRDLRLATDHLGRANRDLGELAAFIAGSLTTVTAIEAVINIAVDRIGLSSVILHLAFEIYIGFLVAIFILGILRFGVVMWRRARAEKAMDRAKRGIYEYCPTEEWSTREE